MSESQFEYSHLTLDELRSLAASPQVGTLHAMPQSFRALADRVGEVADLLTHTQVNMHQWWKGPAAEQAATMLGQAAAEAREFHDTAMGAATAVGHCAQIVTEQQHQMMNVPEVAEPGVTDVVRQPTTPFEALEAMRQDAAYQAAHQQAVQVVNGIAAQYVETRSRLSEIGTFRSENFVPSATSPEIPGPITERAITHRTFTGEREIPRAQRLGQPRYASTLTGSGTLEAHSRKGKSPAFSKGTHPALREPEETSDFSPTSREVLHPDGVQSGKVASIGSGLTFAVNGAPTSSRNEYKMEDNPTLSQLETSSPAGMTASRPEPESQSNSDLHQGKEDDRQVFERPSKMGALKGRPDVAGIGEQPPPNDVQPNYTEQARWPSGDNSTMIPPYTGLGSAPRTREERSRRPAYLKERKSAWVTETIAAPADGVLTPDWFERH